MTPSSWSVCVVPPGRVTTEFAERRRAGDGRVLSKSFEKYGLTLHPQKTRGVEFVRPDLRSGRVGSDAGRRSERSDFLGFTHYRGARVVGSCSCVRKTAKDCLRRALKTGRRLVPVALPRRPASPAEDPLAEASRSLRVLRYFGIVGTTSP